MTCFCGWSASWSCWSWRCSSLTVRGFQAWTGNWAKKLTRLAPAFPGIKPEWYFLWEYQLLKEFPPHLFGLEGPQLCLLIVSLLLGIWAIIPWLDRQAQRDEPSPGFSDFGWGAILFLTFLTLKAWDIGGAATATSPASLKAISWTCAWWTVGAGVAIIGVRFLVHHHRWFFFTGAALLHVVLHGLFGLSYLVAGAIAAVLAAIAVTTVPFSWRQTAGEPGRFTVRTFSLILCQLVLHPRGGHCGRRKTNRHSQKLGALLAAQGNDGKPVISPEQRAYFDGLNDHLKALLIKAVETEIITRADHLGFILALGLRPQKMEVFLQDNCVLCHTDPEVQKPETLFSLSPASGNSSDPPEPARAG